MALWQKPEIAYISYGLNEENLFNQAIVPRVTGDIIFFDEEEKGLENFHMQTFFLYAAPAANNLFVSPSSYKHFFFTYIQFISVVTAFANNLFQNFPTPPPPVPRQKNNGLSLISFTKE